MMHDPDMSGARLRAARIAAGYLNSRSAAERLQITPRRYALAERRLLTLHGVDWKAAWAFGVTREYLLEGWIVSSADQYARRVEMILADHEEAGCVGDIALRLRLARINRPYPSATAAARTNEWPISTYIQHENGTLRVPVEAAIAYAVALRCRPEYLVAGDGYGREDGNWPHMVRLRRLEHELGGLGGTITLELKEERDGKLEPMPLPFLAPKSLFPTLSFERPEALMGIVRRNVAGDTNEVWVVREDRSPEGDGVVVHDKEGLAVVDGVVVGQYGTAFDYRDTWRRPVAIGTLVATIRLEALSPRQP